MNLQKTLISSLILASFLTPSLSVLNAQTVSEPVTQVQIDALQQTLVSLLTQLIAQLQAQIADLIAQQAATASTVSSLGAKVDTVTQTAPVVGVQTPTPSISMDFSCENGMVKIATNVSNAPIGTYHVTGDMVSGGFRWSVSEQPNPYISYRPARLFNWEARALANASDEDVPGRGLAIQSGTYDGTICAK